MLIAEQTGSAFAASNRARFISLLTAPAGPAPAEGCAGAGCVTAPTGFNKEGMARVQAELDAWSAAHAGHPLAYTVGNAKTGDTASFVSGCASKPNADGTCKKADEDTIFRLASMTKIMGGTMAAIAFEEGKVKPGDSISNWIPEFDAANLKVSTTRHFLFSVSRVTFFSPCFPLFEKHWHAADKGSKFASPSTQAPCLCDQADALPFALPRLLPSPLATTVKKPTRSSRWPATSPFGTCSACVAALATASGPRCVKTTALATS